jgi:branched-chain amino acid transport system substrate-binding protein
MNTISKPHRGRRAGAALAAALALVVSACASDANTAAPTNVPPGSAPEPTAPVTDAVFSSEAPIATEAPDSAVATTEVADATCAAPAAGEPIKIGHINITGEGINIPGSAYALEVYFDKLNACGGFDGRPLQLVTRNGGLDPGATTAAARELVEQENVIAFLGSNAFLDCVVNGEYYLTKQIPVIASSYDGLCFTNEVIFPHLSNFDRNIFPGVVHALENGKTKFGYLAVDIPGQRAQADAIAAYVSANGGELVTSIFQPLGPSDPTSAVLQLQQSGAEVIIASTDEVSLGATLTAAIQQGIGPADVMWIAPNGVYSPRAVATLGAAGDGLLVVLNHDAVENGSTVAGEIAADVQATFPDAEIDGFVNFGFMAGEVFEAALAKVDGELTSASLLTAMNALGPVDSALAPGPQTVNGPLPRQLISYGLIVELNGGVFTLVRPDWITFPKS